MDVRVAGTDVHIEEDRVKGEIAGRVDRYIAGEPVEFSVKVDLSDYSPFQRSVLEAVSRIPYGETQTYGEVARAIGNPGAARAVAQACNSNPVPIIIPCHRVVASDGIGGYCYGEKVKKALLYHEDAI